LASLCKLFKLNRVQELVFVLALQNSIHIELQILANEYIQQRLPELIQLASGGSLRSKIDLFNFLFIDNQMNEIGLADLPVEVLHSLLLLIQQYMVNECTTSFIKNEDFENFLDLLRKG
jgi:hypothetical protein